MILYVTHLFDRDNRFLFCNYKVIGECINKFYQRKSKFIMQKISITLDNSTSFLVIIFVIFRVFREYLKLYYLAIFLTAIFPLKFQIKEGFRFNFTSLQKCSTND